jgi:hypothetical protein
MSYSLVLLELRRTAKGVCLLVLEDVDVNLKPLGKAVVERPEISCSSELCNRINQEVRDSWCPELLNIASPILITLQARMEGQTLHHRRMYMMLSRSLRLT